MEVQPYPFTTRALYVGHTDYQYARYQVLDTPGLCDTALEQRTVIEMQAITALAHLNAVVIYFMDPSQHCGQDLQAQLELFRSLLPLFRNKPLVIAANKSDLHALTTQELAQI